MNTGNQITLGMLAAIVAGKVIQSRSRNGKAGSGYREDPSFDFDSFAEQVSGIPQDEWYRTIDKPFADQRVMDMLTRNMFINSIDYYNDKMVFVALNVGQLINPALDPIKEFACKINQPGVKVITNEDMDILGWLRNNPSQLYSMDAIDGLDPRRLFMVELSDPELPLTLETSYFLADTIGGHSYYDVWYNLTN